MVKQIKIGLTFNDVLLIPKKSIVNSRKEISLKTKLTKNIDLNIPIVSSNMDTVTESAMAIKLARNGGIGIIHRFMPIDDQVKEVLKVKRSESIFIDNPLTLTKNKTLFDARKLMQENNVSGILIIDSNGKLDGILTLRDILFEKDPTKKIFKLMTKNSNLISAEFGTSLEESKEILRKNKIEKLPITDKNGYLVGLITSSDISKKEEFPHACKDKKGRLRVGAAVGVKEDFLERAETLISVGCDVIVVDIAHGHSNLAIRTVKQLKNKFDIDVIAGNVASAQGTKELIDAGADGIKVGIGGGSICITRIITGSGVPQLTAIMDSCSIAKKNNIPVIADGGIRNSGDITKALAAGASSVMLGNLLAGTKESPGITIRRNNEKYKVIRGMASLGASLGRESKENNLSILKGKKFEDITPEGVEGLVKYKGNVSEVLQDLIRGIQSGLSYCGVNNLIDLKNNSEFIRLTQNSLIESNPHDIKNI